MSSSIAKTPVSVAHEPITAVFWDFGGVILSSPFDAFARYERQANLPEGTIRGINATNPDTNAWAKFERSDVSFDEFCGLFEGEAAAIGHTVNRAGSHGPAAR